MVQIQPQPGSEVSVFEIPDLAQPEPKGEPTQKDREDDEGGDGDDDGFGIGGEVFAPGPRCAGGEHEDGADDVDIFSVISSLRYNIQTTRSKH